LGTGVLAFESDLVSLFELGATGIVFEFEDDGDSFEGDSSLMRAGAGGSKPCNALGDSFRVMIRLLGFKLEDFLRAPGTAAGLFDEAIVVRATESQKRCAKSWVAGTKGAGMRRRPK
jgi:hypothetical protein